jgi:hypothetical protein
MHAVPFCCFLKPDSAYEGAEEEETIVIGIIDYLKSRLIKQIDVTETLWSHLLQRKVIDRETKQKLDVSKPVHLR